MSSLTVRRLLAISLACCVCTVACSDDDDGNDTPVVRAGRGGSASGGRGGRGGASGAAGGSGGSEPSNGGSDAAGGAGGLAANGGRGAAGVGGAPVEEPNVASEAADLRAELSSLLCQHVAVLLKASHAVLAGRSDEFNAYYDRLTSNGYLIGDYVGVPGGNESAARFANLWTAHNLAFVTYLRASVAKDKPKQDGALASLNDEFVPAFGAFFHDTVDMPQDTVEGLAREHLAAVRAAIDAQAETRWDLVFSSFQSALAQTLSVAAPISEAIVAKLPDTYSGQGATPSVDFRVSFDQKLLAHGYLASWTTAATLGDRSGAVADADAGIAEAPDRSAEATAARSALDASSGALGQALAAYAGDESASKLSALWAAHDKALVDYATGIKSDDASARDNALKALNESFVPGFAELGHAASGVEVEALTKLAQDHVVDEQAVIDLQGQDDSDRASVSDVAAGDQLVKLGDTLSIAIVTRHPEKF